MPSLLYVIIELDVFYIIHICKPLQSRDIHITYNGLLGKELGNILTEMYEFSYQT